MFLRSLILACLAISIGLPAGCTRKRTVGPVAGLEVSEKMTLYSIDGTQPPGRGPKTEEQFHGYPVLGKVEIEAPETRKEIALALKDGMARNLGKQAKCFWPRHAIRSIEKGKTVDLVICFECYQLQIHSDGRSKTELITEHPQSVLDQHLQQAGVPLAPRQ